MSAENKISYYVLRTRPIDRIEFWVLNAINQREHPAMVPVEARWVVRRGQRKPIKYPWFPYYVFVGAAAYGDIQILKAWVNDLAERMGRQPPVVGAVGYGQTPATLSNEDVEFLRSLSTQGPTTVNLHKSFRAGSRIEITDGPFRGLSGTVDSVTDKRVTALIEMFGTMRPVEIEHAGVRAA